MASRVKPSVDHTPRLPKAMVLRLSGIYQRMVATTSAWNDAYALACESLGLDPADGKWIINFETGQVTPRGPQPVATPPSAEADV